MPGSAESYYKIFQLKGLKQITAIQASVHLHIYKETTLLWQFQHQESLQWSQYFLKWVGRRKNSHSLCQVLGKSVILKTDMGSFASCLLCIPFCQLNIWATYVLVQAEKQWPAFPYLKASAFLLYFNVLWAGFILFTASFGE